MYFGTIMSKAITIINEYEDKYKKKPDALVMNQNTKKILIEELKYIKSLDYLEETLIVYDDDLIDNVIRTI